MLDEVIKGFGREVFVEGGRRGGGGRRREGYKLGLQLGSGWVEDRRTRLGKVAKLKRSTYPRVSTPC